MREALALINQTLDEALAEQEGDFDADSRWALTWFEQSGFAEGEYGVAEQLSKSKNTSVDGYGRGRNPRVEARQGTAAQARRAPRRLGSNHRPAPHGLGDRPSSDPRACERRRERAAAALVAKLGAAKAEVARELAYRLYTLCERKKRAAEALSYNGLVQSWPEITRLASEGGSPKKATAQTELFDGGEE